MCYTELSTPADSAHVLLLFLMFYHLFFKSCYVIEIFRSFKGAVSVREG